LTPPERDPPEVTAVTNFGTWELARDKSPSPAAALEVAPAARDKGPAHEPKIAARRLLNARAIAWRALT
jgi:hypothetical protein